MSGVVVVNFIVRGRVFDFQVSAPPFYISVRVAGFEAGLCRHPLAISSLERKFKLGPLHGWWSKVRRKGARGLATC